MARSLGIVAVLDQQVDTSLGERRLRCVSRRGPFPQGDVRGIAPKAAVNLTEGIARDAVPH